MKTVLRRLWIFAGLFFMAWLYWGFQSESLPGSVLTSSSTVHVTPLAAGGWRFEPKQPKGSQTLVFLPGGMVEPIAYAPLVRSVADSGFPAILQPLPWRGAFTEAQRADLFAAISQHAQASRVVLAGHSRGAMLAARYAHDHPTSLAGLVLVATTHPRDFSLADFRSPLTKVYGTNDGVAGFADMQANTSLLPPQTRWAKIEGGNHVQFGFYRHQLMSGSATISRDEQQRQTLAALLTVLAPDAATPTGNPLPATTPAP